MYSHQGNHVGNYDFYGQQIIFCTYGSCKTQSRQLSLPQLREGKEDKKKTWIETNFDWTE